MFSINSYAASSPLDEITALTNNIKNIKYVADGGAYIRIDFNREYEKNEIVSFDYSIHQSYMYVIEKDNHLCRYSFTPGWFDKIDVKHIQIKWNKVNVIESNSENTEGNYLLWEGSLSKGARLNASVKYNLDTFTTNEKEQYTEDSAEFSDGAKIALIILGIFLLVVIVAVVIIYLFDDDDYGSHGGFRGGSNVFIHSSCARSSCACVSSCACACACAGGGRAGCSKKDFYGTNLQTEKIEKILNKTE